MRGRGVALLVGMKAGEARAEAAQQQQQQAQAAQQQAYEQGKQESQQSAKPASSGGDLTAQLNNLNQMHASGALSDEEYAAAKKKLLS